MSAQTLSNLTATHSLRSVFPALISILLGSLVILAVGFSSAETVHNTAHDTRHAANFPCH